MTEREIFVEALILALDERPKYLDRVCGVDGPLRRRLDRLLALHDDTFQLLDAPASELPLGPSSANTPEQILVQLAPFLSPSARPDSLGRLGHYDVLEVLGRGGCGIVLRAVDDKLQRVVAVKVLAPHLAATSPPRQRFLREARAAARVRNEHVAQVYSVEEEPIPYLVMEFVPGESLQQRLDRIGPRPLSEAIRIGRQVAIGLAAAHEQGLIHRDVKPSNILLDDGPELRAKLTDFGLARAVDDASLTQSGVLAGTPMFMSPEQARGGEILDPRTDLFSLGSVLYTMVAGRPPFRAANAFAVLKRVVDDAPRPLQEVVGDLPPGLVAVIERLMAKDPADRFATARDVADSLDTCLTAPPPTVTRYRPRRRTALVAMLLLAMTVAIGAVWHFTRPPVADLLTASPANPPSSSLPHPPPVADAIPANALIVTSPADDGTEGTLRWAVEQANSRPGEDTIVFDAKAFATRQTITLTRELRLSDRALTTILGPPVGVTITGKQDVGGFNVHAEDGSPATATIRGLTLSGFNLGTGNGSRGAAAIISNGDLVLDQVTVAGCFCNFAGGILNHGTLRVTNSTFTRNRSTSGGAILNAGTLTVLNSTFSGNHADGSGGGIHNGVRAQLKLIGCTITANEGSRDGGGVFNEPGGTATLGNTIVAGNKSGASLDLLGEFTATNCLIGSTDGATLLTGSGRNVTGESPRLGPLRDNGGPTETHLPLADSPVLDAGDNGLVPVNLRTDQRGKPRLSGDRMDIGAIERE